jgi:putative tryptophan/tyrosine transport system substrate-binding protein
MRRRDFIAGLGGAAAWPLAARAQQSVRMRRIGFLLASAEDDPEGRARMAFVQGLQDLGWTDGRNVRIDYRYGLGDNDRFRRYAVELVALSPDVLLAASNRAFYRSYSRRWLTWSPPASLRALRIQAATQRVS